ncbi:DUF6286 domain-containing protein [Kineococcus sp. GCM10028916]|uniref:DUF6286 domain-containing protein n=1 Tax=Kineococcus sp. GCM10028916 TaxID=3273394 RepID=UPI0036283542
MSSPERAAAARTGSGRIGAVGPVLAVLLLALAVVLGREAGIGLGWFGGGRWLPSLAKSLDGLAPSGALVAVCCVAIVLGAWLVVTGFGRRSRRAISVDGAAGVHLSTRDVARLASGAARRCDGVLEAKTTASRKTVSVAVQATSADVREDVARAVAAQLAPLSRAPRVRVRVNAPEVLS